MEKTIDSLETKMLKLTCILVFILAFIQTLIKMFLKSELPILYVTGSVSILSIASWWILKRFEMFKTIRISLTVLIAAGINLAWYLSYSSVGPILMLFILFIVFVVFVWPTKTGNIIISLLMLNLLLLFYLDYNYHDLFPGYTSEHSRIADVYIGTFIAAVIIFLFGFQAKLFYLKKYREARKSDELKSAFLTTMSHELRTPLNAIIGFSDLIDNELEKAEVINYANIIHSSGIHLLRIIEDMFDLSLIESNQIKIRKETFELQPFLINIHEIITNEKKNANKENLKLNLIIPVNSDPIILHTDPERFKQIFINLLKNAIKFTHEGQINFGYTTEKEITNSKITTLKFFVEDTGIGISKENIKTIFDIFSQVENDLTRHYDGIGIGLSISKKLTHALGGNLWVESVLGKGSTFYFTIPGIKIESSTQEIQTKRGIERGTTPLQKKEVQNKTVLIVEDDEISYEYLKTVIRKSEIDLIWAKNGKESIDICRKNPDINLVLMDINLPLMNGFEATKAIKEFRPDLPIIAQTAYFVSGDREKLLAAGCDDYIVKPIYKRELLNKVNKFL